MRRVAAGLGRASSCENEMEAARVWLDGGAQATSVKAANIDKVINRMAKYFLERSVTLSKPGALSNPMAWAKRVVATGNLRAMCLATP